jgi:monoamine oxidase
VLPTAALASEESADVLILGAGLSGLYSAMLLEQQGFRTIVLEARDQVGGRLLTLDGIAGRPEGGGQTIGGMYARVIALADQLGIDLWQRDFVPGLAVSHRGSLMPTEDWGSFAGNPLGGPLRGERPDRLYSAALDSIAGLEQLDDWTKPEFAQLDQLSIRSALAAGGVEDAALDLAEIAFDGRSLDHMSALFALRKDLVGRFNREAALRVEGGSQRLPEAMAALLKEPPRLGSIVTRIENRVDGITVRTVDGKRYSANFALCSLPFPALRQVALDPEPPMPLDLAIRSLPYTPITLVHLAIDRPFWEDDGLSPNLWTSDPMLERVFAFRGQDRELSGLVCWYNGFGALRVDRMTEDGLANSAVAKLAEIRPSSKGHVRPVAVKSWGNDRFAGGAYHFLGTGQAGWYREVVQSPWNRLRFIGEHTATFLQGMEGALESAEREALAIMEML